MLDGVTLELRDGYEKTTGVNLEKRLHDYDTSSKRLRFIGVIVCIAIVAVVVFVAITTTFNLTDQKTEMVSVAAILGPVFIWSIVSMVIAQEKQILAKVDLDQFRDAVKRITLIKFDANEEYPSILTLKRIRQNMVAMAKDVLEADKILTWWRSKGNKENLTTLTAAITRYKHAQNVFEAAEEGLTVFGLRGNPEYNNTSLFKEARKDDTPEAVAARKKAGTEKFKVPLQVIRP